MRFYPLLTQAGDFDVYIWYVDDAGHYDSITTEVFYNNGNDDTTLVLDQTSSGGQWVSLGRFAFQGTDQEYGDLL